ncbi:hypothetical protein ABPG72_008425 [Tetrahymena utriculariae]
MGFKYLLEQYEQKLLDYKYSGVDHSLLYNYIMSPFANFCLKYVPESLAPNVITLLGLLCVLIPHFILWAFYPVWELSADVHPAMLLFLGISHLVYMNFDNLDGKQARKTGNSSPLGLLFDHGCDSLIVFIQGISLATCLKFGNNLGAFFVIYLGAFTFFTTTIEEYYTHTMYLPPINGAAEGCFGISVIYFITAGLGCSFWDQESFGIVNRYILLGGFCLAGLANLIGIVQRIYASKPEQMMNACRNMLFFLYITFVSIYAIIVSQTNTYYMRIVIYIFGFSFAKLVSILQISHVSDSPFIQFRRSNFIILSVLFVNTFISQISDSGAILDEQLVLWAVLIATLIAYGHLVFSAINQFCEVLRIRAFIVKQRDIVSLQEDTL